MGSVAKPTFADIDGDGDLDAFVGNKSGNTLFYRNSGTSAAPSFTFEANNPFGLTAVGYSATPTFADIDGDGDLDAFVGSFGGNTTFFRNSGTATAPTFTFEANNPFGLTDVGTGSVPTFADIDGDGDLDAFVGNRDGNTLFYRNSGTATAPTFTLEATNPFGLTDVGSNATPTFADIDGDGDLDAFVGNKYGNTLFFENQPVSTPVDPTFNAPITNPFGLTDVGRYATPTFADIDGDGDLDAFVGNRDGNTLFYRNSGPASAPAFTQEATNPFGLTDVGRYATPTFADIDGDGDLDAFMGNYDGNTLFYRNNGTKTAPTFTLQATNPFGLTNVGTGSVPTFADIDGDGDLDAFVGNANGNTLFYRNNGTKTAPTFTLQATNPFGLTDVGIGAVPTFADIDGDGDLDAFVGNLDGNTQFYRNSGTATAPTFTLEATNPFGLTDVGFYAVPTFADIDGDGDLDAFVGNYYGDTLFFENTSATTPTVSITAQTATANEGGSNGVYRITRTDTTGDLTINLTLDGGSTAATADYSLSGGR
ncbi:FG-GAP repeat domain-containing protein [Cylindrospermum sp. FACHB-282]|uniref:FG-GAP repeat domain-containing protein n=1 Tax=Cylindrospermum sp. FACHB-282 TaxID=2692794 RepID=UPI001687F61A|nr:VCBS repeat-containing protein [Cylindrospermum sp. FACHB-282]MBD2388784.1 VCBS repeat-containing protein [Cylindrospermum sp. FACHB-282]